MKTNKNLATLIAGIAAAGIIGSGCAHNRGIKQPYEVGRNNSYVMNQAIAPTNVGYFKLTEDKYKSAIDMFQAIGESGAVKGFTFPAAYSAPTVDEESKEKIAEQIISRYQPGQLAAIVARYGEHMAEKQMDWWFKNAIVKDLTNIAVLTSVISAASSSGGSSATTSTPTPKPTEGTIGPSGSIGFGTPTTIVP